MNKNTNISIVSRVINTIMIIGTLFIIIIYTTLYFINIDKSNKFNEKNLSIMISLMSKNINKKNLENLINNEKYIKQIIFNNELIKGKSFNEKIAFKKHFKINSNDIEIYYGKNSQDEYVKALAIRMAIVAFGFYVLVYLISIRIKKVLSPFEDIVLFFKNANINNLDKLNYKNKVVAKEFKYVQTEINSIVEKLNIYTNKINFLAYNDELTNLSNRRAYYKDIYKIVENAKFDIYVLFLDLDGFKDINDKFGHKTGDIVLKEIANRLMLFNDNFNVYRVGGDEFIIIIEENYIENVIKSSQDIISTVSKDILENNEVLSISTSIGISTIKPKDINKIDQCLKESDIAMYEAKKSGKNQFKFITKDMITKIEKKDKLIKDIKIATENEEFTFVIQPQVDSRNNKIIGAEALIRWNKDNKLISPYFFINELEDSVFIIPVSNQIMKQIFLFTKELKDRKLFNGRMSINLSEKQINDKSFLIHINRILKETECDPKFIEFEITERWSNIDTELILNNLTSLKNLGFNLSIDDFGEDNSSFKRTDVLPIDKIKLDKNFADRLFNLKSSESSILSTLNYSNLTKREFLIEGVETKEQVEKLKELNVFIIQGYFFYKPMKKNDFIRILS